MSRVVMENYDPEFAGVAAEGDILAGGFNFGTGSSREQAVTALQAKGIALVVAGSFSQTYLRNAFNNGFVCLVQPEFIDRLREARGKEIAAGKKTIVVPGGVEIDFKAGRIRWQGESFTFPPLGTVPQSLVVAGGVENLVRRRLGLD